MTSVTEALAVTDIGIAGLIERKSKCSVCAPMASVLEAWFQVLLSLPGIRLSPCQRRCQPHHGLHSPNTKSSRLGGVNVVDSAVTNQLTSAPGSGPPAKYLAVTVTSPSLPTRCGPWLACADTSNSGRRNSSIWKV